jgi:glycosyltransferase involved in cell wall biosynthesis
VSIVLPSYNGEKFIFEAIQSLTRQTHSHLEILVCDDHSTDQTCAIVKSFNDSRIQLLASQKNQGLSKNLNRGIQIARGDYICWFNQDDICLPEKTQKQLQRFTSDDNLGAVFCKKDDIDVRGSSLNNPFCPSNYAGDSEIPLFNFFLYGCNVCAPTVMIKREVFAAVGYFDESLKIALDLDMWLRISKEFPMVEINEALLLFRHHDDNQSGKANFDLAFSEAVRTYDQAIRNSQMDEIVPGLKGEVYQNELEKTARYFEVCLGIARNISQLNHTLFSNRIAIGFVEKALMFDPHSIPAFELLLEIANKMNSVQLKEYAQSKLHANQNR